MAISVESGATRIAALEAELAALRREQASWRQREQELSDFVENAVVGLHKVGPDGTILWANRADYELLGYTADEYVGHNIAEFHADRDVLCSILDKLVAGDALREQEATLRCKDGTLRHVVISSNGHFEDGRFVNTRCFTRDVTAQRLAEAALQQTRRNLAAIVESSEDAIIGVRLDGRINAWNRGAERMYGYAAAEILGHSIHTIVPEELRGEEDRIFARVRGGERVEHYETERVRRDGTRVPISLSVSPVLDSDGSLVGISKVGRDISERKRAERELAEAARRKDEFLAILAHELRNPLAPIRYALSVGEHERGTAEQRRAAQAIISRQVEHMAQLLDDLLDVSRIARGKVELRKKWVDLTLVVGSAIDAARPLLDAKGHELVLDLPREPLRLEADPVRLTQILSNLLTNAAKYTDRGGHIQLSARREGGEIVLAVQDDGIGIAPEMRERLFTLFAQAEPALDRSEGGLGIGLALVKGFVERHGGKVSAHSEGPGKGSRFVVRLPVGAPRGEDRTPRTAATPAARRLRALVADDNTDSAQTCSMLLELWGHEVRVVHSGREAIAAAEEFRPDVALIDIGMPHLSGYDVARAIRSGQGARGARLIAVTGWGQEDDRQRSREAGFDHHLTKPVNPEELQRLLEALTAGR